AEMRVSLESVEAEKGAQGKTIEDLRSAVKKNEMIREELVKRLGEAYDNLSEAKQDLANARMVISHFEATNKLQAERLNRATKAKAATEDALRNMSVASNEQYSDCKRELEQIKKKHDEVLEKYLGVSGELKDVQDETARVAEERDRMRGLYQTVASEKEQLLGKLRNIKKTIALLMGNK